MKTIYMEATINYLVSIGYMSEGDIEILLAKGEAKTTLAKNTNYIVINEKTKE